MGSKPIDKIVKVELTIVPTLWGGCNYPLRHLTFFLLTMGKEYTGVGLTLV